MQTYLAEQQRYMSYITGGAVVAQPAAMATPGATSVRANLPERFTGNADHVQVSVGEYFIYLYTSWHPEMSDTSFSRLYTRIDDASYCCGALPRSSIWCINAKTKYPTSPDAM
eukprot:1192035-Prorocentrum_minimum.AAC.3